MKQTDRWEIAFVVGAVSVMACVLIAASGRITYGAAPADGLTPTVWVYSLYQ